MGAVVHSQEATCLLEGARAESGHGQEFRARVEGAVALSVLNDFLGHLVANASYVGQE